MKVTVKKLVIIGCVHSGAKAADIADFKKYADLAEDKDTYLLILGDLFENAIPSRGEGMTFEQTLTPDDQLDEIDRILRPVKHKIIGACTSNHSERTYKECGIDLDKQLYKRLGMREGIYKGLQGVVQFAGKKIAFAHGTGSGANAWADAKKLFSIYPTVDMIAVSHRHEMTAAWHGNYSLDSKCRRIEKSILFVRTGGLMGWARYAQRELYTPQKPGFSIVSFFADGHMEPDISGATLL